MATPLVLFALGVFSNLAAAWLPEIDREITSLGGTNLFTKSNGTIRGVDMGAQFVFEPWIAETAWDDIGCGTQYCETNCVREMGQDAANAAFAIHWDSWITREDIREIASYGLNTIRVPIGFWMLEDIVDPSTEAFPQGGFPYLERFCGWASDAGLYIILDLHGATGAQVTENPDTGRYVPKVEFYNEYQYERALLFLEQLVLEVHVNHNFRNVGMLEIVNEPLQDPDEVASMRETYYPRAFERIRAVEMALQVRREDYVHIQMMNELWGAGNPKENLTDLYYAAYDDHRYLKYDASIPVSKDSYLNASCTDDRGDDSPTIVGEWSLSPPDDVQWDSDWDPDTNVAFYRKWFAAQVMAYEKQHGWIFWTWKAQLDDYRWSYKDAVAAGVIPLDLDSVYDTGVCDGI
ncbi:hypothetical protein ASPZODRAFT_56556 [Penicilliopsis zonata CBS 506.65]|uniref:glucan endo-1,6-beta-glucosidase n=1 Tax=Penicilliopsis zonata CBS 506.65 TaxID=1073090 RepID=A0A1L9SU31_9EURO|nr:hypothetical protein ASPZODRAFT_56556 [Penicilliopsis zonata CBS 506.65]OJJ50597.1 hypothetical protein ASPZODRAFT_56556 [Penicilliopsis zonata CBS 506.65]